MKNEKHVAILDSRRSDSAFKFRDTLQICFRHVGYLTSGFKYFSGEFGQAVDQHTTRRALFDTSISFLSTLPKNSQNDKI